MADLVDEAEPLTELMVSLRVMAIREALQEQESEVTHCESCGYPIGEARLKVIPGATLCVDCQARIESLKKHYQR